VVEYVVVGALYFVYVAVGDLVGELVVVVDL